MVWTCTFCTFENEEDTHLSCIVCGNERDTTTTAPAFPQPDFPQPAPAPAPGAGPADTVPDGTGATHQFADMNDAATFNRVLEDAGVDADADLDGAADALSAAHEAQMAAQGMVGGERQNGSGTRN